jgi:hypothetical protein
MVSLAWAGLLLLSPPGTCPVDAALQAEVRPLAGSDSLAQLYARGKTFAEFLSAAKARRETWHDNYSRLAVTGDWLQRARAVPGHWRLLVVAEDWCGDSANTIPYLAQLSDSVASLKLRIVNAQDGRWVMESHRTPDGRAATPTVVLLDSVGAEAGCFVERPAALREWLDTNRPRRSERELGRGRDEWRRRDRGQSTVRELVELLESAAGGRPRCGPTKQPDGSEAGH